MEENKEIKNQNENQEINGNKEKRKAKRSITKALVIILIVLLTILIAMIESKYMIVRNMQWKISNYKNINNFHVSTTKYLGNTIEIGNLYYKDGEYSNHIKTIEENNKKEIISFKNGNNYLTVNDNKTVTFDGELAQKSNDIVNYLETESIQEMIVCLLSANVSSVRCNSKDCYKIENFKTSNVVFPEQGLCVYVDKETGLLVRTEQGDRDNITGAIITSVTDYSYEFNTVTDEDLKEPDIKDYKIQEKNTTEKNNNNKTDDTLDNKTQAEKEEEQRQAEFRKMYEESVKNLDKEVFLIDAKNYNPGSDEIKITEAKAKEIAQKGFEESAKRIAGEGANNKESEKVRLDEKSPNSYFTCKLYGKIETYKQITRQCYVITRENDIGNGISIYVDMTTGLIIGGEAFGD